MMEEIPVTTKRDGRVLIITLDRPHVRNAVNGPMARALSAAMDLLDADPTLDVGVLTGAGGGFSAGNDLRTIGGGDPALTDRGFAGIVERPSVKPLIAAVEGFAAGGGFEIALACDIIIAGRSARFMLPEVRRGLVAGGGGILRLVDRAPRGWAIQMVLTGDECSGAELETRGVATAVADGTSLDAAVALAHRIAENSPSAVAITKQIIDGAATWPAEEAFDRQRSMVMTAARSADAREGARAFLEKRAPQWPSAQEVAPAAPAGEAQA